MAIIDDKWVRRFLDLAHEHASWSKDPNSKIGAVAVDPRTKRILSSGYNGFPKGIADTEERLNDRPVKLSLVVHAEANLIYNATRSGVSLDGACLFVWGLPVCLECAKAIVQVGIQQVFITESCINKSDFWKQSWENTKALFDEAGVSFTIVSDI